MTLKYKSCVEGKTNFKIFRNSKTGRKNSL